MSVTIDETRAKEMAGPDAVAIASIDRDTGAAEVLTIVGRSDGGCEPEGEENAVDRELGPSIPRKEMC